MWVERRHPRDRDGKFAHTPGGGGLHVVSTSRGGPVVAEAGRVRSAGRPTGRPPARPAPATLPAPRPAGPAGIATADDGVFRGSGLRHSGTINGREYHLKRAGGVWSVYDGTPETGTKIGTAKTIADAKALAHSHAGGARIPDAPAGATTPPAAKPRGQVRTATRAAQVSPTTSAAIRKAREQMPESTAEAWHTAALKKVDAAELARLKKAADRATATHNRDAAKLTAIREDYRTRTAAAMKAERDAGLHTRFNADGKEVPITDAEIEARAERSALNLHTPEYKRQQKKAVASLMTMTNATADYDDARRGQALPRTADGLAMPSDELNGHLDRALEVGRAVLADHQREVERLATAQVREARQAIAEFDALAVKLADADAAYLNATPQTPVTITMPDGRVHRLTDHRQARDLEMSIRRELHSRRSGAEQGRRTVARHEQQVLRDMLSAERPMGGIHHSNATPEVDRTPSAKDLRPSAPRDDWRQRLADAEDMFPRSWLAVHAGRPLSVGTSQRAYYVDATNHISFSNTDNDFAAYDGGFKDKTGEVAVHELGHRMEQYIPGLTALEFTMVRRRAVRPDGSVQKIEQLPGYSKDEKGQPDEWGKPYAGKTYEGPWAGGRGPHETSWELFQVGLQDTFGRSRDSYGRKDDPQELQAFVIGALLTLGR